MLRLLPFILLALYVVVMWFFSAWRMRQDLNQNSTPLNHPRLNPVLAQLGAAMNAPTIPAHIYEVEAVNGLAVADGRIFLTRGFIRKLDACEVTPEELASVIAHELGHVSLGHSRRRMIDFAGQNAVRMALGGLLGRFIPFVGPWIATVIASTIAARLSRNNEYEADTFAAALMIRAGLGTEPQISLFRKLSANMRNHSTPAWLMSHPSPEKRIAAIESHTARWQAR
ncbi:M48 family metallopeptidase [Paracoccus sp. (in: a-proteobacteria)]|uniref:M48 family metallopeptidase n=1 Tax=Paracoccus sp. TaxID=267 RepID=UPI0026DF9C02|nr:M48 family metallopeptidase [Paracoccus sp. (in: a-proteobacteria)]MDO5646789.1 M48 family metallopeptidase [Paracoccus sp. (in: a-proteobacteria)]